jgi:hypothetical protein
LEHDYPHGSAGGRRRGESEVREALNDLQINAMINYLAENSEAISIGSIILPMQYLGWLAFTKRFNDLDMAIDDIRRGLVTDRYSPVKTGVEELRLETLERVDDLIYDSQSIVFFDNAIVLKSENSTLSNTLHARLERYQRICRKFTSSLTRFRSASKTALAVPFLTTPLLFVGELLSNRVSVASLICG